MSHENKININNIHISHLEKAMNEAISQFELFQDRLSREKPENWERDSKIIETLKRNLSVTYKTLIDLES